MNGIDTALGNAAFRWVRALMVFGVLVLGVMRAGPAEAQIKVGNVGQDSSATARLRDFDLAQAFTTGSHAGGYTMWSVKADFASGGTVKGDQVFIIVYEADSSGQPTANTVGAMMAVPHATYPDTVISSSIPPDTTITIVYTEFSANIGGQRYYGGIRLAPNKTYSLVFSSGLSYSPAAAKFTSSDQEDSGSTSGWSLADNSLRRPRCTSPCSAWSSNSAALRVQILAREGQRQEDPRHLSVADASATEGPDATLDFVVTMQPEYDGRITVVYETRDNTAKAGQDYEAKRGTLAFEAGETTKTIKVPVIDDDVEDDGETMWLKLEDPSRPGSIFDGWATGTILNNDTIPGHSNAAPTGAPTINGTPEVGQLLTADVSGIADADGMDDPQFAYMWFRNVNGSIWTLGCCGSTTYTPRASDEGHAIYVRVSYTDNKSNRESVTSEPTAPVQGKGSTSSSQLSVADADATEGDDATLDFVVTLDPVATTSVTVDYATSDGSATAGADYTSTNGTLTFAIGDATKTVLVPIADDASDEENETLSLTLSNPTNATLSDATATGTINDNDEAPPLTATFENVPSSHDGDNTFAFGLAFSEEVEIGYQTLRDEVFEVTSGTVRKAQRQQQGSNQAWNITVEPSGDAAVTIKLPATTDCNASGAICTADGRALSNSLSATVAGPVVPLTASFSNMPATHTGAEFTFGLAFSEDVELSYVTLRDQAFEVTGGVVRKAQRQQQGSNQAWNITVEPTSANDTVAITLPQTTDCGATGAVCTDDDRPLSHPLSATVVPAASASADRAAKGLALDDALGIAEGVTPDDATAALFGELELSEARQAALDRLGNRNGQYDLGDVLSWIDRCQRGEARCGTTSTGSSPVPAAALLTGVAAEGRRSSRRRKQRDPGCCGRRGRARRRTGMARYAIAMLLTAAMSWSCTDDLAGPPAATVADPGFLTIEWSGTTASADTGVLIQLEGPGIETVRAPGLELYRSTAPGPLQVVVAGSLRPGPLVQFRVPDRNQLPLYRVRVLEVTGENYGLRDAEAYRAVITN
ncbi:MAG: hypothetical protein OXI76_00835 [Gemmatimonadota bacterium]|nr:hypothetical protein [Gemmatimonadota bacterium]